MTRHARQVHPGGGSTFTANHATQGGAIDQDWYATLTGDSFTRNSASARGRAMFGGYNTTVSGSTFTRNTAGTDGGAIDNGLGSLDIAGPLTITGGSITGTSAGTDGGGTARPPHDPFPGPQLRGQAPRQEPGP